MAEVRIIDDVLTWDLDAMNGCRESINACCSGLMFGSNAISNITIPSGEEYYATTFNTMVESIDAAAKILLKIKNSLLNNELELEKAEQKSEDVISEIFDRYFYQGLSLNDTSFFNQLDYGDIPYAKNNVQKGGCGITCLAGLFTDLFGNIVTPADLAGEYSGDKRNGGTSDKQMIQIANDYGVSVEKMGWTEAWSEGKVMEALANGQQVIMCVRNCAFTKGGHYIRLVGLTEDGKIIVHDPNGANWTKPNLKDGFENGFDPKFMSQQGGSAFIFDNPENTTTKSEQSITTQPTDVQIDNNTTQNSQQTTTTTTNDTNETTDTDGDGINKEPTNSSVETKVEKVYVGK